MAKDSMYVLQYDIRMKKLQYASTLNMNINVSMH